MIQHRMRRPMDFKVTVSRGRRYRQGSVVVHCRRLARHPTMVGFVVAKTVGNAVIRNRVKRRLREIVARVPIDNSGVQLVIRAQPAAASCTFAQLQADLLQALNQCGVR